MLIKQKSIISQKLDSQGFWQIAYSVLNKDKSTMLFLFDGYPDIFLPGFPSRNKLELPNIFITHEFVNS